MADPAKQALALTRFDEEGIQYEVQSEGASEGMVVTLLKDQARVDGITREVHSGPELSSTTWETAVLLNDDMQARYEAAFEKAGIDYSIVTHEGTKQIEWNQLDGPKVDLINQRIAEQIVAERK
ncbi:hypothetical protein [Parahalioglobus pacificus]|nr:hypothetical protein [Halioglobus pacificus]